MNEYYMKENDLWKTKNAASSSLHQQIDYERNFNRKKFSLVRYHRKKF